MIENKAKIAQLLNIAEKDVDDNDKVMAAVQNVVTENGTLRDRLKSSTDEVDALKNQIAAMESAKVKSLIDSAIAAKKIGEDERDDYTKFATDNFELAEKMIGKLKGVDPVVGHLGGGNEPEEEKDWTFDDYHKNGKLENLKKERPEKYNRLFKIKFGHNPNN